MAGDIEAVVVGRAAVSDGPAVEPRVACKVRAILHVPASLAVRLVVAIRAHALVPLGAAAQGARFRSIARALVLHDAAQVAVQQVRPCGTGTMRARSAGGG